MANARLRSFSLAARRTLAGLEATPAQFMRASRTRLRNDSSRLYFHVPPPSFGSTLCVGLVGLPPSQAKAGLRSRNPHRLGPSQVSTDEKTAWATRAPRGFSSVASPAFSGLGKSTWRRRTALLRRAARSPRGSAFDRRGGGKCFGGDFREG